MIVIYVLSGALLLLELSTRTWLHGYAKQHGWVLTDNLRIAVVLVLITTSSAHFSSLRYDLLAMLPPPIPREMWIISATGVIELLGAAGLLSVRWRSAACASLIVFLMSVFPANIYAALNDIPFSGRPATPLPLRTAIQILLIGVIGWVMWYERRRKRLHVA
ncbi:hypothetical protein [Musicola keenii]|uniref:DoxX family protein n=1 Tax=Musicola keenii TaxID=2884250 RepID=UPI001785D1AE|nr:hypothetical protein [Musicola keenii]